MTRNRFLSLAIGCGVMAAGWAFFSGRWPDLYEMWWWPLPIYVVYSSAFAILNPRQPSQAQKDNRPNFIVMGGPAEPPPLSDELLPYVQALQGLFVHHRSFFYLAREEARKIGQQIHEAYGHDAMVTICDTLRFSIGAVAARELESVWDGIGIWSR